MCGITGFWQASGFRDDAEERVKAMVSRLDHRGPESVGVHIDEKKGLAMGHSRLCIIDLFSGNQPILSNDSSLVLTANGEFYDYKRHRANLMADGARFRTKSDSEIAIHYYKRLGLDFVEHLRGEFAFVLYDGKNDRLILVRDRFGIRPLFYHINGGNLYYGSEAKALLENPDVPCRLNHKAALHQLMQTTVPGTSAFDGIQALKPGHMLIVQRLGSTFSIEEKCYWDVDFPTQGDRDGSATPEDYIELIRDNLIESVIHRLEADVPVGCYLSGGIDSCSILGLATGAQQSPVKAFTIGFDNAEYDEAAIAQEMAESMNAEQDVIRLKADDLYGNNYLLTMYHAERTFYNTLGVAKFCMSRHVHEAGYKTVVTGEGADELFAGYPSFKRDMFLHGLKDEPADVIAAFHDTLNKSNKLFTGAILAETQSSHPAFDSLCGFTPSWIQPWMATLKIARPLLNKEIQEELAEYDPIQAIADSFDRRQLEGRHPLDKAQYTWMKTMMESQILNWGGDRVDMANSMESRPAFLDHHLVEAARMVPPNLRIRGNTEKWILREAMKGILPEVLYKREKFAFMAPPGHTEKKKQKAVEDLQQAYLNREKIEEAGLLDAEAVEIFLHEYEHDTDPVSLTRKDALLNHLLGLQILHDQYIVGNVPVR